jgi:hypothetical protein
MDNLLLVVHIVPHMNPVCCRGLAALSCLSREFFDQTRVHILHKVRHRTGVYFSIRVKLCKNDIPGNG